MITYKELLNEYYYLRADTISYRLGQHFINRCIAKGTDPRLKGLWDAPFEEAVVRVRNYYIDMQWPLE